MTLLSWHCMSNVSCRKSQRESADLCRSYIQKHNSETHQVFTLFWYDSVSIVHVAHKAISFSLPPVSFSLFRSFCKHHKFPSSSSNSFGIDLELYRFWKLVYFTIFYWVSLPLQSKRHCWDFCHVHCNIIVLGTSWM